MNTEALKQAYQAGQTAVESRTLAFLRQELPRQFEKVIQDSDLTDVAAKVAEIIEQVPEGKERRRLLHKMRRMLDKEETGIQRDIKSNENKRQFLSSAVEAAEKIEEWFDRGYKLQKPVGTMMHAFQQALVDGNIYNLQAKDARLGDIQEWEEIAQSASVFMIQHDWATAFQNAKDYLGGEIKLPDDACAFEFRISDRHVIVFATDADGTFYLQYAIQVRKGWLVLPVDSSGNEGSLFEFVSRQIKAIAVALDAEIATTEVVRAPHKLNHARERAGKLPLVSYHVVNLARRSRAAPLPADDHEPAYRVRLHFRRGHWRHYEDHKTWIKWMLVGDPELGFVDKEYRL